MQDSFARARTRPSARDDRVSCIQGMPLKEEIETKFLGATIDDELTWQSHIDNVYKKLKSAAGILAHMI